MEDGKGSTCVGSVADWTTREGGVAGAAWQRSGERRQERKRGVGEQSRCRGTCRGVYKGPAWSQKEVRKHSSYVKENFAVCRLLLLGILSRNTWMPWDTCPRYLRLSWCIGELAPSPVTTFASM